MRQINDIQEWQKNGRTPPFDRKRSCLKRIKGNKTGEEVGGVGTLLLGNDKNNVIADKVLSYF